MTNRVGAKRTEAAIDTRLGRDIPNTAKLHWNRVGRVGRLGHSSPKIDLPAASQSGNPSFTTIFVISQSWSSNPNHAMMLAAPDGYSSLEGEGHQATRSVHYHS